MENDKLNSLLDEEQVENVNENIESSLNEGSLLDCERTAETSLLDDSDMSVVELNNDVMSDAEINARKKYFSNPENQAKILLNNYIKSQTILVNRYQRRKLYKEFLHNAKLGKYRKIFNEQIYGISKEESQKNFAKLND